MVMDNGYVNDCMSVSVCSPRHMIAPEREALFAALANNLDIINQQKQRLDRLESDLHKLRLYRGTSVWSFTSQTPSTPSRQRWEHMSAARGIMIHQ